MTMLNDTLDPLQRLLLAYAPSSRRARYALLFALDNRFAAILRSTTETLLGQMRLTWWRDALTTPQDDRDAGEPLLEQMAAMRPSDWDREALSRLIEGWILMLEPLPWDDEHYQLYATARGEGFFGFALGETLTAEQAQAARCWACWDLATGLPNPESAMRALADAAKDLQPLKFNRSNRPLSILVQLMRHDMQRGAIGQKPLYRPQTAARIIWHGLTGR
ncbi:MAG: hypothetical protein U5J78_00735 [Parasphingorhabdus sp.]|nr:hypothetical protein [Parasphingorhabdus sp.]